MYHEYLIFLSRSSSSENAILDSALCCDQLELINAFAESDSGLERLVSGKGGTKIVVLPLARSMLLDDG